MVLKNDRQAGVHMKGRGMPRILVIADDFTGANDTGVQMRKSALTAVTIVGAAHLERVLDYAVVVIDAETRRMMPEGAAERTREIAIAVRRLCAGCLIYKKVDSSLRGHIGRELEILKSVLNPGITVFAPAYPGNGRTTREAIQCIDGVPLDQTELVRDPLNPIRTADIRKVIAHGSRIRTTHIPLADLRGGSLLDALRVSPASDYSFDAETQADLRAIVAATSRLDPQALWVGSAGLAEALVEVRFAHAPARALAVVGSLSRISRRQAQRALAAPGVRGVRVGLPTVPASSRMQREERVQQVVQNMNDGFDVVLLAPDEAPDTTGVDAALSGRIAQMLAEVACETVLRLPVAGVFVTGGDTAIALMQAFGALGVEIESELEPGIPLVRFLGGVARGMKLITKAGSFGTEQTLLNAIDCLRIYSDASPPP